MLTSVGQAPFSQMGTTQPSYPSVSLQQSFIPSVQLPSAVPQLTPRGSQLPSTGSLTPRGSQLPSTGSLTPRGSQLSSTGSLTPRGSQLPSTGSLTPRGSQLPSTGSLTPRQFPISTPPSSPRVVQENLYGSQTPRSSQQPNLMTSLEAEGRKLQPQVNNALDRVGQEFQGFFRWLFAPIRH